MTARPWMPLYIGDYLADTSHLTATEHGAYLLLLMHQWQHGSLPQDDELLTRIARVHPPHWPRVRRVLISFFETQEDGSLRNKRLAAERDKASELSQKRATAARQKHIISRANADALENASAKQLHTHARASSQPQPHLQEGSQGSPSDNPEPEKPFPSVAPSQASGAAVLELVSDDQRGAEPELPAILDRRSYPDAFEALWSEYRPIASPNATKADAHRAWAKLSAADREACWTGLVRYAVWIGEENARRAAGKRSQVEVKHLATFINRRGWEPYLEEAPHAATG